MLQILSHSLTCIFWFCSQPFKANQFLYLIFNSIDLSLSSWTGICFEGRADKTWFVWCGTSEKEKSGINSKILTRATRMLGIPLTEGHSFFVGNTEFCFAYIKSQKLQKVITVIVLFHHRDTERSQYAIRCWTWDSKQRLVSTTS